MRDVADLRPEPLGNTEWNRRYHDWYARQWRANEEFRVLTGDCPGQPAVVESTAAVGTEWAPPEDLAIVCERFILPYIADQTAVLEVGPGGGRVARLVADRAGGLVGADVSIEMLREARAFTDRRLAGVQIDGARLPIRSASIDFAYAFDVLVHADLHVMFAILAELARVTKLGSLISIHTANLESSRGWANFAAQKSYSPEAHFFVTPATIRLLLRRTGFEPIAESTEDPGNFYLSRDYVVVARNLGGHP